jgi:hypothetical protein
LRAADSVTSSKVRQRQGLGNPGDSLAAAALPEFLEPLVAAVLSALLEALALDNAYSAN